MVSRQVENLRRKENQQLPKEIAGKRWDGEGWRPRGTGSRKSYTTWSGWRNWLWIWVWYKKSMNFFNEEGKISRSRDHHRVARNRGRNFCETVKGEYIWYGHQMRNDMDFSSLNFYIFVPPLLHCAAVCHNLLLYSAI